jgi:hypothetical protein
MQLNQYELLKRGIYVENMTSISKIKDLTKMLSPIKTKYELIRIGGENDGGYLLPNDLIGIDACFSPGVADNASFEHDLFLKTGILSHLADYSVNGPPNNLKCKSFTKKYLGCINDDTTITLDSWVNLMEDVHLNTDFIMQMDIEGAEYPTLLDTSVDVLLKFRIITIEFHQTYAWGQLNFFNIAKSLFDKLLCFYYVVHNHPNNNDGSVDLGGLNIPRTFELTLLRKDRSYMGGFCHQFPHPLDRENVLHCANLILPNDWFTHNEEVVGDIRGVLCRPRCGLNDLLCSIERCWSYAVGTNRKLYVDSSYSGLRDNFWIYFLPVENSESIEFNLNYPLFDLVETFPKSIQGRVSTYTADYSLTKGGFTDNATDEIVSFDINTDFNTPLLVHEQGWIGGYLTSSNLLTKLRLTERVKLDIKKRLKLLPEKYFGIHIRHTDYLTDYVPFLEQLKLELEGENILICSDNFQVINYVKSEFLKSHVTRLSTFGENGMVRLHEHHSGTHQYTKNIEALTDLFALALARNIYFTNVNQTNRPSGFSLLAMSLNQNKHIVTKLLS